MSVDPFSEALGVHLVITALDDDRIDPVYHDAGTYRAFIVAAETAPQLSLECSLDIPNIGVICCGNESEAPQGRVF